MLNRVQIIGRLGADPEAKSLNNGGSLTSFTVACSESFKDKHTGEKREKTEWIRVSCFNEHLNKVITQYLRKGSLVFVEGKYQTRKWQAQDGTDRYSTEVVMSGFDGTLKMLGGKQDNERVGGSEQSQPSSSPGDNDDFGDSIPF